MNRKNNIDNLRNLTILLLFPVHTFMIWNDFGSRFYIWEGENKILSTFIVLVNPWFMPLLFVIAGISARYALENRTVKEFMKQRFWKLMVPFLAGMVILVPFQTLYARKYFQGYEGGILENWKYFFTHFTDLTGYDGAFTPGHLWFILFLFIISVTALGLFHFIPYKKTGAFVEKMPVYAVIFLFIPVWLMYYLGNFGGFSLGKNLALYLAGYYVLGNDTIIDKLERNLKWLAGLFLLTETVSAAVYYKYSYYGDLWVNFTGWVSVLAVLAAGKKFLNKKTGFTEYFNRASYPVYILHQSILVALAYYVVQTEIPLPAEAFLICAGSFLLTILSYHIIGAVPILRKTAGIR